MTVRRLQRIFRLNGRTLIVAFDHGLFEGPARGMQKPAQILNQVVAGGADAILTSYGVATRFTREIASLGLILRLDGGCTRLGPISVPEAQLYTVADALRLGADAVAVSAFPGLPEEEQSLETLARVVSEAHAWGLPVMAEMVPGGFNSSSEFRTAEAVALAARVAAEQGADWVKVPYVTGFDQVTSGCYVPAVILGGAKKGSEQEMLTVIQDSLRAGGAGVAIGRNVFQAENPAQMVAAIAGLIHQEEPGGAIRIQSV